MRAREPDREGFVAHDGVKLHYEVHGEGGAPTVLLLPTWTIIHKRYWKAQLAYLARHFRVVTYDGPGNGGSDRPTEPAPYRHDAQVASALAVLDATGTDRACVVSLSQAANWSLDLAANQPERVLGAVYIAPSLDVADGHDARALGVDLHGPAPAGLQPSVVPGGGQDQLTDWRKHNVAYWQDHHEDFLWFFFGQCLSEPFSTKPIEDCVSWGLDTGPEVLMAEARGEAQPQRATLEAWAAAVTSPTLVIHGDHDRISPLTRGERLAELTGGELLVLEGSGHLPLVRDPVAVNLALRQFVDRLAPAATVPAGRRWRRAGRRPKRVLYLSSPIGLGHARRDLAIAQELRDHHPDVEIDWLAQHPVTRVLEEADERIHPASRWLANESAHIEAEAGEHDLHCFQALREMDEILVANFMLFHDVVTAEHYDLVVSDEGWEVDHFLHENPELKRFAYAWLTDFVGMLPMPGGEQGPFAGSFDPARREEVVAADVNAEMIEHIERFPWLRDRAVFVGNPEDVVPERFGPDLPPIPEWTREHYDFAGYVTGFDPAPLLDRDAVRAELGYRPEEQVCVVTVGGSGVGGDLLRRVIAAYPEARRRVAGLRMVVVAGPRIDPATLPDHAGLEVHAYVPALYRHLAACDLAVVQGGLTTCMEVTALGRPFVYVPLRHHFEQNLHVHHRLQQYGAGRRLDYDAADPDHLADVIATEIGREVAYRPVEPDGAARAAALLADLL